MVRIVSLICSMVIVLTSPFVKYLDSACIDRVYATGLEIPATLASEVALEYLLGFFATLALGDAAYENRDALAESYMEYVDIKMENDQLTQDTCMMIYDKATGAVKSISWEEFKDDLKNVHDISVDKLTDVYAKYCPQLLSSMKEFVTDVLSGDVYVEGMSEAIVEYAPVTESDIGKQRRGDFYTYNYTVDVSMFYKTYSPTIDSLHYVYQLSGESLYPVVGWISVEFKDTVIRYSLNTRTINYSKHGIFVWSAPGTVYLTQNGELITGSENGKWLYTYTSYINPDDIGYHNVSFSVSANFPVFSSSEAAENYLKTGTGYENALNFGKSMDDEIIDAPDIPPFTRQWQQEQWERIANAPDVIGIGSYGTGADVEEWADIIPWIGLDSLQEYVDVISGIYDKVVDNVITGTYDSNKDLPETYSDAWEFAVSEAWANVEKVDSPRSDAREDTKEEPSEGEDGEKNGYYKKGLVEIPDDWIEVEAPEELEIKSQSFLNFLREQGYNPKNWVKIVEKWASPDGIIYQRNYWTDGTDYFYHGEGIEEFFPH